MKSLIGLTPNAGIPEKSAIPDIIQNLLMIFVLSEVTARENDGGLNIDERIKRRRGVYRFDMFLQHWITQIPVTHQINVNVIPCGNTGYYRADLVVNGNIHFLFMHSFDRDAKYIQEYLQMNDDASSPKFAYFLYDLDPDREKIKKIKVIIPGAKKTIDDEEYDLTAVLEGLRLSNTLDALNGDRLVQVIPLLNAPPES